MVKLNDINKTLGGQLIFLISQPRAGSTMLQRILGSHPSIHTSSEPWLMLHPIYGLRSDGFEAEYNAHLAHAGVHDFLQGLDEGEHEYAKAVRLMYLYLYDRTIEKSGRLFYLDKTPRYYLIIPDLSEIFPEAKFIILLRNPLAVLISILNTWKRNDLFSLYELKDDLLRAPQFLLNGKEVLGNRCIVVHYESLLQDTVTEIRIICDALGLKVFPSMVNYGDNDLPRWSLGDQKVYQFKRPDPKKANAWIQALDDPMTWRLAKDYLDFLGRDTVTQMGYSYGDLDRIIQTHRPQGPFRRVTAPIMWLLKRPPEDRSVWERCMLFYLKNGLGGACISLFHRLFRKNRC